MIQEICIGSGKLNGLQLCIFSNEGRKIYSYSVGSAFLYKLAIHNQCFKSFKIWLSKVRSARIRLREQAPMLTIICRSTQGVLPQKELEPGEMMIWRLQDFSETYQNDFFSKNYFKMIFLHELGWNNAIERLFCTTSTNWVPEKLTVEIERARTFPLL